MSSPCLQADLHRIRFEAACHSLSNATCSGRRAQASPLCTDGKTVEARRRGSSDSRVKRVVVLSHPAVQPCCTDVFCVSILVSLHFLSMKRSLLLVLCLSNGSAFSLHGCPTESTWGWGSARNKGTRSGTGFPSILISFNFFGSDMTTGEKDHMRFPHTCEPCMSLK